MSFLRKNAKNFIDISRYYSYTAGAHLRLKSVIFIFNDKTNKDNSTILNTSFEEDGSDKSDEIFNPTWKKKMSKKEILLKSDDRILL